MNIILYKDSEKYLSNIKILYTNIYSTTNIKNKIYL